MHADDPEFGYRFIADELEPPGTRSANGGCGGCVASSGSGRRPRRRAAAARQDGPGRPCTTTWCSASFTAPAPDVVWLTDITEHPTAEGKLYCCAIKDVFSNRIVGYAIGDRMTAQLAVGALRAAIARRQPAGTVVVHSDRGGAVSLQGLPGRAQRRRADRFDGPRRRRPATTRRWSRSSRCCRRTSSTAADGGPATSSPTRSSFWIEHTYNRRRRQRALGKLTPVEFELAFTPSPTHDVRQHDQSQPPSTEPAAIPYWSFARQLSAIRRAVCSRSRRSRSSTELSTRS